MTARYQSDDFRWAWERLRREVRREQREWTDTKLNKEGRVVAAAMCSAYGGVLRAMERIENSAATRKHKERDI